MPSFSKCLTTSGLRLAFCCVFLAWCVFPAQAQELEPRRWAHLPVDTNFGAIAYAYKEADISFDPVLQIENAKSKWAQENLIFQAEV